MLGNGPQLPEWASELLESEPVGRLAHLDGRDLPRVLPVTFAVADGAVWSAIDHKPKRTAEPARVGRLRRRPEAALCVDRYDNDWTRLAWVQLLGRVTVVDRADAEAGLAALAAKYEPYRDRPPAGPFLRLDVERAVHWRASDPGWPAVSRRRAARRSRPPDRP
jgi:PPOX class probable F420-dependent enzyme